MKCKKKFLIAVMLLGLSWLTNIQTQEPTTITTTTGEKVIESEGSMLALRIVILCMV